MSIERRVATDGEKADAMHVNRNLEVCGACARIFSRKWYYQGGRYIRLFPAIPDISLRLSNHVPCDGNNAQDIRWRLSLFTRSWRMFMFTINSFQGLQQQSNQEELPPSLMAPGLVSHGVLELICFPRRHRPYHSSCTCFLFPPGFLAEL
jgi:hypothetical protein